ncbi:MAG: GAF domain-containing sensor histidine kinase [Candidatus Levybacteria bacterium]|nr:GAF domain-containing sensor histidine kinase [Candidatus Levybacteria bacterium]
MEHILENISKSGLKFLTPLSLSQTYTIIVEEAVKLLQADIGYLYLAQNGDLQRVAMYPNHSILVVTIRKKGFTYTAYSKKKAVVVYKKEFNKAHPELKGKGYKSAICIPLSYHNKSTGALMLVSKRDQKFSQRELGLLKVFGSYASLAIQKAQLTDENSQALETRDLFISMAAHELRTPITTIYGYAQLLQRKLSEKEAVEAKWADELKWETQRLTLLVNEFLEVNRIKEGHLKYHWKEVSMRELVERALANFPFTYPGRPVHFTNELSDGQGIVIGDYDKLLQVLGNILDNAAKFSPANTTITVTLGQRVKNIFVRIKDEGKGIVAEDLPHIFKQYYRKAQVGEEGMGIGLFLVKSIISLHKGSIKVKSKPKKGTTVTITLPKSKK